MEINLKIKEVKGGFIITGLQGVDSPDPKEREANVT